MSDKQWTGKIGEELALNYLKKNKRFKLQARNFQSGKGEIDLIVSKGCLLVFVEVRTRTKEVDWQDIYSSIRYRKRAVLRQTARLYLLSLKQHRFKNVRFDVIGIQCPSSNNPKIKHWENCGFLGESFL